MNLTEQKIIAATLPAKTKSYTPIAHVDIIRNIQDMCEENNLSILDRSYQVNSDCTKVTGKYTLSQRDSEMGTMIAFQNSYDKSMSA